MNLGLWLRPSTDPRGFLHLDMFICQPNRVLLYIPGAFSYLPTIPRARVSSPQKVKRRKVKTPEQESRESFQVTIGPPRLTRFERARIIGARSLQLSLGAPPFIKVPGTIHNPIDIAIAELDDKVLPINIRRTLPDGQYEDIPLDVLAQ